MCHHSTISVQRELRSMKFKKRTVPDSRGCRKKRAVWLRLSAIIALFLCIAVHSASLENRIVLEGFHDGMLGYERVLGPVDIKVLGAVEAAAGNYLSLREDVHIGRIFPYGSDVEFIGALGVEGRCSWIDRGAPEKDAAYSLTPSCNLSMYKFFKRVLLGGCIALDLWEVQKVKNSGFESNWYGIRLFDIEPQFIVGFCF